MNWLTNYVRPKLSSLVTKKPEVPDNMWTKCPACSQMLYTRELEANLHVCARCGHHLRLRAAKRLEMLFDDGQYETITTQAPVVDPLRFRDRKRYGDRLKEAQASTGLQDAFIAAHGRIGNESVVVVAFDFEFMGGSMGIAVGDGFLAAAELAVRRRAAFLAISSSGGARMQEGILSLMQLPRTVIAVQMVKEAGLPYLALLADPTTGGVSASFAMLGDIAIAETGAVIGFAGARVIEETIRQTLPEGFQRAEYLNEHGMVDLVVHRKDLRPTLVRILRLIRAPHLTRPAESAPARP